MGERSAKEKEKMKQPAPETVKSEATAWEKRQKIPPLSKQLHGIEDIDQLPDAEALATNIDNRRADVINKYRVAALEKYMDDSKKYWAKKEKRDKRHLKKLRKSHEKKRRQYEAVMSNHKQKSNDLLDQIRAEAQHERNKLAYVYNKKLEGLGNKEKLLREYTEVEKRENAQLEDRVTQLAHEMKRVKKDFEAYEEMSKERDQKTAEVRKKTDEMRNVTYRRLAAKEKDSKVLDNKSKEMIKQLHLDAWNHSNYTNNRSETWERKVKQAAKAERSKKALAESTFKKETQKKMEDDKKKADEDFKKEKE